MREARGDTPGFYGGSFDLSGTSISSPHLWELSGPPSPRACSETCPLLLSIRWVSSQRHRAA